MYEYARHVLSRARRNVRRKEASDPVNITGATEPGGGPCNTGAMITSRAKRGYTDGMERKSSTLARGRLLETASLLYIKQVQEGKVL